MRRSLLLAACAFMATAIALPEIALAQGSPRRDQQRQEQEAAKKKKSKEEWNDVQAPLQALRNAGPCPFVKVLYDAGRYIEFKDDKEASANVGYSGEIQGISAGCAYKDDQPIQVEMEVLFELGKGPQAQGSSKNYRYWVAVTKRNEAIIAKQYFDLPVSFGPGQDRVYATEKMAQITIPRAKDTTSGANFEILVGFDVTPQMAAFNRDGKRFRVNAGTAAVAAAGTTDRQ
ncbi:MAG: Tat pathway signal sequence domain protein [Phenylobacterium sp.]|uniref:Tat pathway signal sequence domain protein n=1 Tax=Phenylobacterium sp. TaxID=1871053 RepID=UPI0027167262|nr:Tat pathway signal sequence domain protein [Phenylobacterium sp.]MDO8912038.1 Tat pathway signal sequence domain protein [Phenylobacterium sp.]MDP2010574.1 Tat pathway signal sequence domain protein [Phenylobacterium sp.]MDP3100844.1 Tat pathway signal sequence domain protein [Phenylobacterium sp.]MDP3869014.1 Tat pathway signal sequence domain protein [Phenylobacterium sp.]HQT52897.1 Tat pathway signal sequence domain protein [Phenylobacterium sp.]